MLRLWWPGRPGWQVGDDDGSSHVRTQRERDVVVRLLEEIQGPLQASSLDMPVSHGRLVLGDNLDLLTMLDREGWKGLDLVYVDPPFGTGKRRTGSKAQYQDHVWNEETLSKTWRLLTGIARLLSDKGQVMVHVDWRASAWMRLLLDEVLGPESFRNEIVWHYSSGGRAGAKRYARKWDAILWYAPGKDAVFRPQRIARPRNRCPSCGQVRSHPNHMKRHRDAEGRTYRTISSSGRVYRYYDDELVPPPDVWQDISHIQQRSPERRGYPTQKPEALLERIVMAHSDPGDMVADFFCGSATTLAVAHKLGRRWLGCDASKEAVELSRDRLAGLVHTTGGSFRLEEIVARSVEGESAGGTDG